MPVRPPAAIASRRTEGNQKRRRKWRRFCGGRTEARPRASSLRVCLADIEKESSLRLGAALWGSGHTGNFQAHAAEATGERATDAQIITYTRLGARGGFDESFALNQPETCAGPCWLPVGEPPKRCRYSMDSMKARTISARRTRRSSRSSCCRVDTRQTRPAI